jgi:uncharacterized membrane protein
MEASVHTSGSLPEHSWAVSAARVTLAIGVLAIAGASVGLGAAFVTVLDPASFLTANTATADERIVLLGSLFSGMLLALFGAVALLAGGTHAGVARICRAADLLAPFCLFGLIPILLSYFVWSSNPLTYLVLLAVAVLVAERCFERFLVGLPGHVMSGVRELRIPLALRRHAPTAVVVLGALAYSVYFSHYTMLHHRRFGTSGFDLGINVNWCFNALQGDFFRTTVLFGPDGGSMIAGHAIYAVFLWLPWYALAPGAEVLLIYQATTVGLAAIPLYLFARTQLPRWSAAAIALAYLLYAPLHGPNFYDYHELLVAMPWHFLLYWLIATNRLRWASLIVVVIWAHREDLAVGLTVVGLFLLVSGARPRFGAGLAAASAVWFVIDKFVIMPLAGSWWFASIYKDLAPAGEPGYGAVVQTILINPAYFLSTLLKQDKVVYFLHLFAPLAFLQLRRPLLALLVVPGFFFTLMTTDYQPTISIGFQYTTHWIPYLFAAAVISLKLIGSSHGVARRRGALCALVLGVAAHSTVFGAVFQHSTFRGGFIPVQFVETSEDKKRYAGFMKLAAKIPTSASLAAGEAELPHVAVRRDAFTLKSAHGDADYLLVRKGGNMSKKVLQDAFTRNEYGLVDQFDNTFYLFRKGHRSDATKKAVSQLGIKLNKSKGSKHGG